MQSLVIKSGGHIIYTLDIEKEILGLDYVSEVMVVGVENGELGQRVAAAVVLTGVSLYPVEPVSYFRVASLILYRTLRLLHLRTSGKI
jgi:malonyl-CoA/methylmalonyl-CoA synthetase